MRKKVLGMLLIVVLALSACSSGNSGNSESSDQEVGSGGGSSQSEASSEEVELSLMIWDANQEAGVQAAVDRFMEINPTISVNVELVPSDDQYYTKLDASLGAQEGPDVMWQSSKAIEYVEGGALVDLQDYIDRDQIDMSVYDPMVTQLYNFDGDQYGMPKDMDAWVFAYNSELFEKYGVEVPESGWTFDDMVEKAEEFKGQMAEDEYPLYYNTTIWNGIPSLMVQLGSTMINEDGTSNFNTDEGKEAFSLILNLQEEGLIPDPVLNTDFDSMGSLIAGKVAMCVVPSWNISALSSADLPEGTLKLIEFPSVNGSIKTDTNGLSYVMNNFSKHKEESWTLIKFLTSEEGERLQALNGAGIPAYTDAQDAFMEANDVLEGIEAVKIAAGQTYIRASSEYPSVRPTIQEASDIIVPEIYSGDIELEDALAQLDAMFEE